MFYTQSLKVESFNMKTGCDDSFLEGNDLFLVIEISKHLFDRNRISDHFLRIIMESSIMMNMFFLVLGSDINHDENFDRVLPLNACKNKSNSKTKRSTIDFDDSSYSLSGESGAESMNHSIIVFDIWFVFSI